MLETSGNDQRMSQAREGIFLYFAYGSNMLSERLFRRCPSARPVGNATAPSFLLSYSKQSEDGSGKATLLKTYESGRAAYGVLFEILRSEQAALDAAEGRGKGYDRDDEFLVHLIDGTAATTVTYRASQEMCDKSLLPYDWYHSLVMAGALQHGLPETYVEELRSTIVRPHPNPRRGSRLEALKVLRCAGFDRLLEQRPPYLNSGS